MVASSEPVHNLRASIQERSSMYMSPLKTVIHRKATLSFSSICSSASGVEALGGTAP